MTTLFDHYKWAVYLGYTAYEIQFFLS